MNILIVNPNIIMGGAQKILLSLAHHLEAYGNKVVIYTSLIEQDGLPAEFRRLHFEHSRFQILRRGGTTTRYRNVNVVLLAVRLIRMRAEIRQLINDHHIDVVIAHQPPSPWLCSFLSIPVIWNCFEPVALWKSSRPEYFSLRPETGNFLSAILEGVYERCDRAIVRRGIPHIFALSKRLAAQIRSLYGREAEVFYVGSDDAPHNGADHAGERVLESKDAGCFVVLQVGQFNYEKNHLLTLDVLKRVRDEGAIPKIKLLLVGEGDLRGVVEAKIDEYGLREQVDILGAFHINDPVLAGIYRRADVLVFPSIMQSWGLVPFEALAHGVVPIVSTDCGAAEVIEAHGLGFVSAPTVDAFTKAIVGAYQQPEVRRERAERGRRFVRSHLTYAVYAKRILERLREIRAMHAGSSLRSSSEISSG